MTFPIGTRLKVKGLISSLGNHVRDSLVAGMDEKPRVHGQHALTLLDGRGCEFLKCSVCVQGLTAPSGPKRLPA